MNAVIAEVRQPQIHVRFNGRSIDLNLGEIDVGVNSTDDQVRVAVAQHLGVPPVKLQAFAVDRNPATGDLTLRPEAVFG